MSMLGKVLAILNVLAALLFVYLAAIDWAKHQQQSYPVFRNELIFHGLPVDDDDMGTHTPPTKLAGHLSRQTLTDIYPAGAGGDLAGEQVRTQEDEVTRVRASLRQKINSLDGDAAKRNYLKETLLGLARNAGERGAMLQRVNDPKVSVADLTGDLDRWFEETLSPARVAEGAAAQKQGYDIRRQAIAHLLYNLSPEPAWHDRVRAVVGLIAYSREAETQAAALEEMARQVELAMADDQATFEREYAGTVQHLHRLADEVDRLAYDLKTQQELVTAHQVLVKLRQKDVEDFTNRLAAVQVNLREALQKQRNLEDRLYNTRVGLIRLVNENVNLERQLRDLELGSENGERP
ncbi:MAG TPA: hypothetical protein VKI65_08915 [Gemmataceae bacterium]|nr:hypothetical protein [Gemmataceae bacterium]